MVMFLASYSSPLSVCNMLDSTLVRQIQVTTIQEAVKYKLQFNVSISNFTNFHHEYQKNLKRTVLPVALGILGKVANLNTPKK